MPLPESSGVPNCRSLQSAPPGEGTNGRNLGETLGDAATVDSITLNQQNKNNLDINGLIQRSRKGSSS
jgi:hypothetical protein